MVLRIKRFLRAYGLFLIMPAVLTVFSCWPYLFRDFLGIEHDTFFHLSRIQGLAEAISRGDLMPAMYPFKNNGFGYASPLFYCDILLYPFALMYNAGCPLSTCYKAMIVVFTWLSGYTMMRFLFRVTRDYPASFIGTAAFILAPYRISDIYVRGACGELAAMIFLPVLLSGIYEVIYRKKPEQWPLLTAGLAGLAISHNLSFLLGVIVFVCFALLFVSHIDNQIFTALVKGCLSAFLLSAFFTLPMLEQTSSQEFWLHHSGSSSHLENYAVPLWKYFVHDTVFGYGEITQPRESAMTISAGWLLTFVPVVYLLKKRQNRFVRTALLLGLVFLILPASFMPWQYMSFLRILQFPWRLIMVSILLLPVPLAALCSERTKGSVSLCVAAMTFLIFMGIRQLQPVTDRTFGITSENTYSDITDGKLCDPYFAATYMRVECAGGDYIPVGSPDFRDRSTGILYEDGSESGIAFDKGAELTMYIDADHTGRELILPLTWYKGYTVTYEDGTPVLCAPSQERMVSFTADKPGTYTCRYSGTLLLYTARIISGLCAIGLPVVLHKEKKRRLRA